jgi:SAM-dependent methyltransferase
MKCDNIETGQAEEERRMDARVVTQKPSDEQAIRNAVRERYARAAAGVTACCGPTPTDALPVDDATPPGGGCCTTAPVAFEDGRAVPADIAASSLGCGAPIEAAALRPGETVVDLGSGAGLDIFLAADRIGPDGRAIGVDMTPEMIARARANAARLAVGNAEFRLGEIEHLPIADGTADVVISNCVINLLPDKRPAFAEAFRVLRPGGRLVVSDIVAAQVLPAWFRTAEQWTACLAGAIPEQEYAAAIAGAGFTEIEVLSKREYVEVPAAGPLYSVTIRAVKPAS